MLVVYLVGIIRIFYEWLGYQQPAESLASMGWASGEKPMVRNTPNWWVLTGKIHQKFIIKGLKGKNSAPNY